MSHRNEDTASGSIEVIAGGMFSGKSEELLRRLRRAMIARQNIQVFKPKVDTRHPPEILVTRDNRKVKAITVADSAGLLKRLKADTQVVGIDEAQFFDGTLVGVVMALADRGMRVIIAGLDQDYQRQPFGPMPSLMAIAEDVEKMHAVCMVCGKAAHYSQRIAGGDEQVEVGDAERYEARCRKCYISYEPK